MANGEVPGSKVVGGQVKETSYKDTGQRNDGIAGKQFAFHGNDQTVRAVWVCGRKRGAGGAQPRRGGIFRAWPIPARKFIFTLSSPSRAGKTSSRRNIIYF